jgi:hypothetical protein
MISVDLWIANCIDELAKSNAFQVMEAWRGEKHAYHIVDGYRNLDTIYVQFDWDRESVSLSTKTVSAGSYRFHMDLEHIRNHIMNIMSRCKEKADEITFHNFHKAGLISPKGEIGGRSAALREERESSAAERGE